MKVAIDISQIIYGTGVSVYTRNLVTHLINLYPETDFVLFGGSLRRKQDLDQFIRRHKAIGKTFFLPPRFLDLLWNSFHLFPIEKLIGEIDVVHTSDWAEPPSKLPKVTTVHDLAPLIYPDTTHSTIKSAHKKRLAWVTRESSAILSVSQSTKKDLVDILKVNPKKITVTYEGVDERYFPQPPDVANRLKKKYHLDGDFLFSLSTLEPRKNQANLILAFNKLKSKFPHLKLLIGGGAGWGVDLVPQDDILMPGFIPETDLPPLYTACKSFVLPSLYEGFGLPLLQAMACGAPVVTSNVSSMPEVVGKAGVLIDPKDVDSLTTGIITALKSADSLSQRSIERAKLFSWDETARLTYEVYQQVAKI